jgi:WD40 repeat protein
MSARCQALAFLTCLVLLAAEPPITTPEGKSSPSGDGKKHLPIRPLVRLGTPRLQQARGVPDVAFSPDGKTLAVQDALWDVFTGKKLRDLQRSEELNFPIDKRAFSPDGKVLAGQCQNCIRLWETATGKAIRVLSCPEGAFFHALTFSPDGKQLATSLSCGKNKAAPILLWETATGRQVRRFAGHERTADQLAFSADGKRLTSLTCQPTLPCDNPRMIDSCAIILWDVASGKQLFERSNIRLGALARDGRLYTLQGDEGRIEIHDLDKRRLLRTLDSRDVWHVFSPDAKILATTNKQNITRLWDVASGRLLQRLAGRRAEDEKTYRTIYYPFDLSTDGKFLATGSHNDGNHAGPIYLWDTVKGEELLPADDHFAAVTCLAFAADGKTLASGSDDRTLHLWDTASGRHLRRFTGHKERIDAVALSAAGCLLASSGRDKTLRLWDTRTGRELHCIDTPADGALSLSFLADDKTLQWWGLHGDIRCYDAASGKVVRRFRSRRGMFYSAPLGADGLSDPAALSEKEEATWPEDLLSSALRSRRESEKKRPSDSLLPLCHIRVSADGRMAATVEYIPGAGTALCRIRVWEVATGGLIADLGQRSGSSCVLVFSANGWGLFTGCDGYGSLSAFPLKAWDLIAGKSVQRFQAPLSTFLCLAVSPDGTKLAAGSYDAMVRTWDIAGLFQPPAAPPLSSAELQRHGERLSEIDAAAAYRAMYRLARCPEQSVPFLHARLRKLSPPMPQLRQLLADLDDEKFAVREQASKALERLGPSAESVLRRTQGNPPSLEVRRRIDMLLEKLAADGQRKRTALEVLRGISVLERIGTTKARAALRDLATTTPDSDGGLETEAALRRLAQQPLPYGRGSVWPARPIR